MKMAKSRSAGRSSTGRGRLVVLALAFTLTLNKRFARMQHCAIGLDMLVLAVVSKSAFTVLAEVVTNTFATTS
jgi:hypothetical protein